MPSVQDNIRRKRVMENEKKEAKIKKPMMIFCLLGGEDNVRETEFDSMGPYHKHLMKEAPLAFIPFNFPLNGRRKEFEKLCWTSNYLVVHAEDKPGLSHEEEESFVSLLAKTKRGNGDLKIYATPLVGKIISNKKIFTSIRNLNEIKTKIK